MEDDKWKIMKIIDRIEKSKSFWLLLVFIFGFFLLRFPSLFEPYWYGDEGITQTVSQGMLSGKLLYRDIWDNKPPLLYSVYALFHGDLFLIRTASLIIGMGAIVWFFLFAKSLFKENRIAFISTGIFAVFFGSPIIEGNIANAENFMILPTLLSFFIFYTVLNRKKIHNSLIFGCGLFLGISFLFKVVAAFDFLTLLMFYLFSKLNGSYMEIAKVLKHSKKFLLSFIVGFLLPYSFCLAYYVSIGSLGFFLDATLAGNLSYVGWKNEFIFGQGLLVIKCLLLLFTLFVLYHFKNRIEKYILFIFIWVAFSLFNAFFSQRPYTHYILVTLPAFSLMIGLLFIRKKSVSNLVVFTLLVISFFVMNKHFDNWTTRKTIKYYQNFIDLIVHRKNFASYQSFFDYGNVRDYAIATFLRKHTKADDKVFIWSNSAQIYYLSKTQPINKYTVAYHIVMKEAVTQMEQDMKKVKPKYIIITTDEKYPSFIPEEYRYLFSLEGTEIYERSL